MLLTILLGALYRVDPVNVATASSKINHEFDIAQKKYNTHCISCHHRDPNLKGSLGPELSHVPLDVFLLKVRTGNYPPGYNPKRKTKLMKPLALKEKELIQIHNWISSIQKPSVKK